jgi:hypothetical protein
MKHKIGKYFLGLESVDVYVDPSTCDSHAQMPGDWQRQGTVHVGFLTIGLGHPWQYVVSGLLHEAEEYLCVRLQYRYHQDLRAHDGPSVGLIVMTHDQFSELTDATGPFLVSCLPDLSKAYKKYHK